MDWCGERRNTSASVSRVLQHAHSTNAPRPSFANVRRSGSVLHASACVAALSALAEPPRSLSGHRTNAPPHTLETSCAAATTT
eukprot:356031-Chlamydomonas_euryale.AAC.2